MSRFLLLLRHAKSAWDTETATDFARPLNKRGERDAPRMGRWLRQQGLLPDYVVSSPAERAKQTALKVCHALALEDERLHWEPRIYEAPLGDLLQVLAACPETARTVLLVGHNPGLELLLRYLCEAAPTPADGKLLPTATVAQLVMPDDWRQLTPHCARLLAITRPVSLP
ncbi:MAG: histidine phosphatase family protein [Candidatus Competibacteraceae bacterium]